MLNLLISILGDTFGRFEENSEENNYKEMIETIHECEVFLFWKQNSKDKGYFAVCDSPSTDDDGKEASAKIESIEKNVKTLTDLTKEIAARDNSVLTKLNEHLDARDKASEKKIQTQFSTLEHQLEEIKSILSNR